eukprot:Hpha_TRINITY_DN13362_c0_g2::TRINITY_DN13362_c0_g2_i1::g.95601::m.95601
MPGKAMPSAAAARRAMARRRQQRLLRKQQEEEEETERAASQALPEGEEPPKGDAVQELTVPAPEPQQSPPQAPEQKNEEAKPQPRRARTRRRRRRNEHLSGRRASSCGCVPGRRASAPHEDIEQPAKRPPSPRGKGWSEATTHLRAVGLRGIVSELAQVAADNLAEVWAGGEVVVWWRPSLPCPSLPSCPSLRPSWPSLSVPAVPKPMLFAGAAAACAAYSATDPTTAAAAAAGAAAVASAAFAAAHQRQMQLQQLQQLQQLEMAEEVESSDKSEEGLFEDIADTTKPTLQVVIEEQQSPDRLPLDIFWDAFFKMATLKSQKVMDTHLITRQHVDECESFLYVGLPTLVVFWTALRAQSLAPDQAALVMACGTRITEENRPLGALGETVWHGIMGTKRAYAAVKPTEAEIAFLRWHMVTCGMGTTPPAGVVPPPEARRRELMQISAKAQSVAFTVSRQEEFRRRFHDCLQQAAAPGGEGSVAYCGSLLQLESKQGGSWHLPTETGEQTGSSYLFTLTSGTLA